MSIRAFALFGFAILVVTSSLIVGSNAMDLPIELILPTQSAASEAWRNAGGDKCNTHDCKALSTIGDTMDVMNDSTATPMKMGGGGKALEAYVAALVRPSAINKRIRIPLLARPGRFKAICRRIKSFVSLYNGEGSGYGDHYFVVSLLQMALLIDKEHPQHCLSSSLAAFPKSAESDAVIGSAESFCESSQWHTPACHRISR